MKRKQINQNLHPFTSHPFEAFLCDSWHPVEQLSIVSGFISAKIVRNDTTIEEEIPNSNLRVKSRKAVLADCTYLRQGVDVCVLKTVEAGKDSNSKQVWLDAKIRSIKRVPHDEVFSCELYVSFYLEQGPDIVLGHGKKLSKETSMVNIDTISILQRLERKPCEDEFYRWSFSEDCYPSQKRRLFSGKFLSDISWLLTASSLKQMAFNVRTIQSHLVYEYKPNSEGPKKNHHTYTLNFKMQNDILTPTVLPILTASIGLRSSVIGDGDGSYDVIELRRSKRRIVQPDRYMESYKNMPDYDMRVTRLGEKKTYKVEQHEISSDDEKTLFEEWIKLKGKSSINARESENDTFLDGNAKMPRDEDSETIGEFVERYLYTKKTKKKPLDFDFMDMDTASRRSKPKTIHNKYQRTGKHGNSKRGCFYVRDNIYDTRSFRKDSQTARLCRELIRTCMMNIDATLKNEPEKTNAVDQWKLFQLDNVSNEQKGEEQPVQELSETDMLWKEMELALASWYLDEDDNEESHVQASAGTKNTFEIREEICEEHDLRLDEQVGMVCELCGFVETDIKDILPPFVVKPASRTQNKAQETKDESEPNMNELDHLSIPAATSTTTLSAIGEPEKNVWALIPDFEPKLRAHQKKAFEFLWRNIAGSLVPTRMEQRKNKTGGCVVSHAPGAGKTLLVIAFLVSYLKLFPGSRPLVLAPKTTLYTWYKEIIKWNVGVPVYQIHSGQTYKGEVLKQRKKLTRSGLLRNQDVMHVLDCLEKMKSWLSHPSILLMGYTSFLTLTQQDSNYAHRRYMAQLLNQCPGILILDEGHNPRSTKSRLRKGLMKVNTRLRILLSGTLFQNNFGEYFNTLCLARPTFVNETIKVLDPKYDKKNKSLAALENRGRKLLIDKISRKIDSKNDEERARALKTLKKLTSKFIDAYEGSGNTDELPGLECYTLIMKAKGVQQEILSKLRNRGSEQKKFTLDVEHLITLGAIHPSLIKTTPCSRNHFREDELEEMDKLKLDVGCASKVRFVMNLVPRCLLRNEKVLIFCHNISPITLFLQIFERYYGWRKGKEVLVLQGDIELFERGHVIDKFEQPNGPSKAMLASITACAEGISLTAASRVILLDSEWNPSKSKQAIARAFRPGQNKVVYAYQLLATGTLEEEKHCRTTWKEWVSDMIFSDEHVKDPSHWQAPKIEDELLREIVEEDRATLFHKIMKNEKASNVIRGKGLLKNVGT